MPTLNPRVQVTLSPSLDALVKALAKFQRASKSQVLRELLEAAEPALQRAVTLMHAASTASVEARSRLARSLDDAQDAAEDSVAVLLSRADRMSADLVSQAETVRARRPARRAKAASLGAEVVRDPPSSNRGVKSRKDPVTARPGKAFRRVS